MHFAVQENKTYLELVKKCSKYTFDKNRILKSEMKFIYFSDKELKIEEPLSYQGSYGYKRREGLLL